MKNAHWVCDCIEGYIYPKLIDYCKLCGTKKPRQGGRIFLQINGESRNLASWSKISGLHYNTLLKRYRKGIRGTDLIKKKKRDWSIPPTFS